MKKTIFSFLVLLLSTVAMGQPTFDLGIKTGINVSKVTVDLDDYNAESVLKMHVGAFSRIGWGRVYVQPEAYFSAKGGEIRARAFENVTRFDFNNVDVPVLLGVKILKGGAANLRVMAGPVFSFITSSDMEPDNFFDQGYYEDNYFGFQYGVGLDFLNFFLDARMEHGSNDLYYHPSYAMKNRTFMITAGFKIL